MLYHCMEEDIPLIWGVNVFLCMSAFCKAVTGACYCVLTGGFERVGDRWLVERLPDTQLLSNMSCGSGILGSNVILIIPVLNLVSLTEFGSRLVR